MLWFKFSSDLGALAQCFILYVVPLIILYVNFLYLAIVILLFILYSLVAAI